MESINSHLSINISSLPTNSPQVIIPEVVTAQETTASGNNVEKSKKLQPDQLALSEEAKAKSTEADKQDKEKKSIDARSLSNSMTAEEAAAAEKTGENDLDKEIRELSMEILDLSVQIQMLQDKEDKESVKERRSLEVDLAIKKGQLEAAMERKLQQAAVG